MAEEYPKAVYRDDGVTFAVVNSFEEETDKREEWHLAPPPKIELASSEPVVSAEKQEIEDLKAEIEALKAQKAAPKAPAIVPAAPEAETPAEAPAAAGDVAEAPAK